MNACREVCSTWNAGVNAYFQATNFHSQEMRNGAKNISDIILKMPLELLDINKIYEMDLHPVCVSFGKKLTLKMQHDQRNFEIFPNYLRELSQLLRTVPSFWERFEHLEVRRMLRMTWSGIDHYNRRNSRHENPDYMVVPFGDVGIDAKFHEWRTINYDLPNPESFEMYIPFLHFMINLKKVTLLKQGKWVNIFILLHIPRTEKLEEINLTPQIGRYHHFWSQSCAVLFQKCAKRVCFLAGVNFTSIKTCAEWIIADDGTGPVFENLKELHITMERACRQDWLDNLSPFSIETMFPELSVLGLCVECTYGTWDLWECLGNFVNKFPRLKYVSLSGDCIPDRCEHYTTIYSGKPEHALFRTDSTTGVCSCLTTFRFQCPMHVPVGLLRKLPSIRHVIIEERPKRCLQRKSKSTDARYVKGFFKMFTNVSSMTFVPYKTSGVNDDCLKDFKTINFFRGDMPGGWG